MKEDEKIFERTCSLVPHFVHKIARDEVLNPGSIVIYDAFAEQQWGFNSNKRFGKIAYVLDHKPGRYKCLIAYNSGCKGQCIKMVTMNVHISFVHAFNESLHHMVSSARLKAS